MAALAKEEGVPLVDLQALSLALWDALGPDAIKDCFLWLDAGESPNYPIGVSDNTHFQAHGAIEVARLVARGLHEQCVLPPGTLTGLDDPVPDEAIVWPEQLPQL
jgi:lysophospholipase L1-like esterase